MEFHRQLSPLFFHKPVQKSQRIIFISCIHSSYTKPTPKQSKSGGGDFILHHYAGSVGYSVAGWLEKNKDPINEHSAQLFSKATDPLVSHLFQDYNPDGKFALVFCHIARFVDYSLDFYRYCVKVIKQNAC